MPMKFPSKVIFLLPFLCACSLYQSDGRKFLEQRAFEYSGASAQANLLNCSEGTFSAGEPELYRDERVVAVNPKSTPLELYVSTLSDRPYVCNYGFTTEQELTGKLSSAIELTLSAPPWAR
jgi:hypothetical protein